MGNTTSMTRNKNDDDDAFRRKRLKTCDNGGATLWSKLNHDVLFVIMMKLGVIDFVSFSGVCKLWRSLALSNKKRFMASRLPMSISIFTSVNEKGCYCYLRDYVGREFKNLIPHLAGRECVGITCGYVVLFGWETKDFWLVNPVTRHQLHFPDFPDLADTDIEYEIYDFTYRVKAILVFSHSINGWVFVTLDKYTNKIWFCIVSKGAWNHILSDSPIHDLVAFKGKIYTLNSGCRVYEMRLNPEPKLTLLEFKNFGKSHFIYPEFVSSGENLYVMNYGSEDGLQDMFEFQEVDFGEMKWVMPKKTLEKYAFFVSNFNYSVVVTSEPWADPRSQYERYAFFPEKNPEYRFFATNMWYFPHQSMNVNMIDEL